MEMRDVKTEPDARCYDLEESPSASVKESYCDPASGRYKGHMYPTSGSCDGTAFEVDYRADGQCVNHGETSGAYMCLSTGASPIPRRATLMIQRFNQRDCPGSERVFQPTVGPVLVPTYPHADCEPAYFLKGASIWDGHCDLASRQYLGSK